MGPEKIEPVVLETPAISKVGRAYPGMGLLAGLLLGFILGHYLPIILQQAYGYICYREPLRLGQALLLSFHRPNWLIILLYPGIGAIVGFVLGKVIRSLQENRQRLRNLNHEFELHVATLRHHYKNLTLGIHGFAQRIKRKSHLLDQEFRRCARDNCPTYNNFFQEHESLKQSVGILQEAAKRLTLTLNQELQFLKALTSDALLPVQGDFYKLLIHAIHDLQGLRFQEKEIQVDINGQSLNSFTDSLEFAFEPYTMEVMLQNILSNSMKYGDHIQVSVAKVPEWVRVEIRDNGPGMEVGELKKRLLTPADKDRSGSHLGLRVTLHLLAKCGGRLSVWSQPGQGTAFLLEFPDVS